MAANEMPEIQFWGKQVIVYCIIRLCKEMKLQSFCPKHFWHHVTQY